MTAGRPSRQLDGLSLSSECLCSAFVALAVWYSLQFGTASNPRLDLATGLQGVNIA